MIHWSKGRCISKDDDAAFDTEQAGRLKHGVLTRLAIVIIMLYPARSVHRGGEICEMIAGQDCSEEAPFDIPHYYFIQEPEREASPCSSDWCSENCCGGGCSLNSLCCEQLLFTDLRTWCRREFRSYFGNLLVKEQVELATPGEHRGARSA